VTCADDLGIYLKADALKQRLAASLHPAVNTVRIRKNRYSPHSRIGESLSTYRIKSKTLQFYKISE